MTLADFFRLTPGEDKVISREQRIFSDATMATSGSAISVTTTSTAPKQKIKFFLDVIAFNDVEGTEHYVKAGKYYELDHKEVARAITSQGIVDFFYTCADRTGNGIYNWTLTFVQSVNNPKTNVRFYVSEIVFEDSYYDWSKGWLEETNPDNIIDKIDPDDDKLPGDGGGGDGGLTGEDILNSYIVLPHHYAAVNKIFYEANVGQSGFTNHIIYNVSPWELTAYKEGGQSTVKWYIKPFQFSFDHNSNFNVSGTVAEIGKYPYAYRGTVKRTEYVVTTHGILIGETKFGEFKTLYVNLTIGVMDMRNSDPDSNTLAQIPYVSTSCEVKGTLHSFADNAQTGAQSSVGCKLVILHNGANKVLATTGDNNWPEWAEEPENNPQPQTSFILHRNDIEQGGIQVRTYRPNKMVIQFIGGSGWDNAHFSWDTSDLPPADEQWIMDFEYERTTPQNDPNWNTITPKGIAYTLEYDSVNDQFIVRLT